LTCASGGERPHAARRLAHLGDTESLGNLIGQYDRKSDRNYRSPEAPFYWAAARLWLMISLDRIAAETRSGIEKYGEQLLKIATDDEFPHVLIRSFAQSAVDKLVQNGSLKLSSAQLDTLRAANSSPIPRKVALRRYTVGFDGHTYKEGDERRFHFDSIDTLPYWYTAALRIFANVRYDEFLAAAESWIVDRWKVKGDPWRWDQEHRRSRFREDSYSLSSYYHGSKPVLERFDSHLEWHAMWCAIGELMKTRPLRLADTIDDYYTFDGLLKREALTMPRLWITDLRGPKPLERGLWFSPGAEVDKWIEAVGEQDFLGELGLTSTEGLVVAGYHETRSESFESSVYVMSALVSPEAAAALTRALQSIKYSSDYRMPPAGNELEIDTPPYRLIGWLDDLDPETGIDRPDPFRNEVRGIECAPAATVQSSLDLRFVHRNDNVWHRNRDKKRIFKYEAWGDNPGDEPERTRRYSEAVRSRGWRLSMDKTALNAFLRQAGFDLVIEIEITRRSRGYEYSTSDEKGTKETRWDKVIILRRDGGIESAEGRIGGWTTLGT